MGAFSGIFPAHSDQTHKLIQWNSCIFGQFCLQTNCCPFMCIQRCNSKECSTEDISSSLRPDLHNTVCHFDSIWPTYLKYSLDLVDWFHFTYSMFCPDIKTLFKGRYAFVIVGGAVCWKDSAWQKQPQIHLVIPDPVLYVQGIGTFRTDPKILESHSLLQVEFSFSYRVSSYSLREWVSFCFEDKKTNFLSDWSILPSL